MKGKRLANFIVNLIEDKKGKDIKLLDVRKLTTLTDYFIICTADVPEHGKAIAEEIRLKLKKKGNFLINEEGEEFGEWIAMDYGEVIVHIMIEEKREFYNLEKIWEEIGPKIEENRHS